MIRMITSLSGGVDLMKMVEILKCCHIQFYLLSLIMWALMVIRGTFLISIRRRKSNIIIHLMGFLCSYAQISNDFHVSVIYKFQCVSFVIKYLFHFFLNNINSLIFINFFYLIY